MFTKISQYNPSTASNRQLQVVGNAAGHLIRMVGDIKNLRVYLPTDGVDKRKNAFAVDRIEPLAGFVQHEDFR